MALDTASRGVSTLPTQAQIVIIGAGIVGCSAAYHLAQRGWRDLVVLEQGPLFETGGSTSHAPGLVFQTNASQTMAALARDTVELYSQLASSEGLPCFYPVGSLEVASTPERWADLHRKLGFAQSWGLAAGLLTPEAAQAKLPLLNASRIYGALHVPSDGIAKGVRSAEALARAARAQGAAFYGETPVTAIEVAQGRVQAVVTPQGRIATERVLVCAGIWGPRVGRLAGVSIPLTPVQHQYVKTSALPELAGETREVVQPILRHQDKSLYFRQHGDCYGIGSYQHQPLLVDAEAIRSRAESPVMPSVMAFTPEHFERPWTDAVELLPALAQAERPYQINGLFSFTPDGLPVLGESQQVRGFWVAEGVWVTQGGGVGKVMAEWLIEGTTSLDLRECDLQRFEAHAHSRTYVQLRGAQQYREIYEIIHPAQPLEQPRPLRVSPFHQRHKELGAVFFESRGWERPQWFNANQALLSQQPGPERAGWAGRHWSPIIGAEHLASRERVALYDLTPLTKLEVTGPGALTFLQQLMTNQLDRPVGRVTYTAMLNPRGGVRSDLTITRLAEQRFQIGANGPLDLAWLRQHLPADGSVCVQDITASLCCLGVWGPLARDLLQPLSEQDFSQAAFPYFTAQSVSIGAAPALAQRVSYVGELGWELYAPAEYGLYLWDLLWQAGQALGILAGGRGAFDSLRLEKGYRLWGVDLHTEHNPYEAGLGFVVNFDKGDFIGREALLHAKTQGLTRRLCALRLDDPSQLVLGKEPIFSGEQVIGYVTSANYSYSLGHGIAYGYLPLDFAAPGTPVTIAYFGERYAATVSPEPFYDPKNLKLKS